MKKTRLGLKSKIRAKAESKKLDRIHGINVGKLPSFDQNIVCRASMTNYAVLQLYKENKKTIIKLSPKTLKSEIKMSVILPFFRAKHVGWVALESLARQQGVSFGWELIIIEEAFEQPFGISKVKKYAKKLEKAGCAKIKYVSLKNWIPLSAKWYFLIQECSSSSKIGAMGSADIYCGESRLRKQYEALIDSDKNWYKVRGNIGYDIMSNRHVKIEVDPSRTDSCLQAVKMDLLKLLPLDCIKINVDGWRYKTLFGGGINAFCEKSDDLMLTTVNVHGLNNLSTEKRAALWKNRSVCCDDLSNHLPKDVANKIIGSKKYLADHAALVSGSSVNLKKRDK